MNEFHASASVPADHPCLAGHFPGQPIVPGVLLLELVAAAVREWRGTSSQVRKFPNVKFLAPLLPGEVMDVHLSGSGAQLRFRCECAGRVLAQGSLELAN
ncbi:MAG: 3-hydroxyacyl-ACP dehydratase FabZ family protein [Stenotrophobium sp.]